MTTGKSIALPVSYHFAGKVIYLLFHMLCRIVIAFLARNKCLLISWLQSPSAVILEPKKIKSVTASNFSPSIFHEVMGPDARISVSEWWISSQLFHSHLWPSSRGSSVLLHFLPLEWYHLHYLRLLILLLLNLDSSLWFIPPGISRDVLCNNCLHLWCLKVLEVACSVSQFVTWVKFVS